MQVKHYAKLSELISDLEFIVRNDAYILWQRENEPSPEEYNLSFSPVVSEPVVEESYRNDACTRCADRISYKEGQFNEAYSSLPYLILVHNPVMMPQDQYYRDKHTNKVFNRIIQGVFKHPARDFMVREVLRCNFDRQKKVLLQQGHNCREHIRADISRFKLRGVLILGAASLQLFDKEKLKELAGKVFQFEGLPAVIAPGPEKLAWLESQGASPEKIIAEKKKIFDYISIFNNNVMHNQP